METLAFNFALDLQEKNGQGGVFIDNLKTLITENIEKIDRSKSSDDILAFVDNSACEFKGHQIILINKLT